jgi:hypothetical protein
MRYRIIKPFVKRIIYKPVYIDKPYEIDDMLITIGIGVLGTSALVGGTVIYAKFLSFIL